MAKCTDERSSNVCVDEKWVAVATREFEFKETRCTDPTDKHYNHKHCIAYRDSGKSWNNSNQNSNSLNTIELLDVHKEVLSDNEIFMNSEELKYVGDQISSVQKAAVYRQIVHSISEGDGGSTKQGIDQLIDVMTDMLQNFASDPDLSFESDK